MLHLCMLRMETRVYAQTDWRVCFTLQNLGSPNGFLPERAMPLRQHHSVRIALLAKGGWELGLPCKPRYP